MRVLTRLDRIHTATCVHPVGFPELPVFQIVPMEISSVILLCESDHIFGGYQGSGIDDGANIRTPLGDLHARAYDVGYNNASSEEF